jgi:hypothetical protein
MSTTQYTTIGGGLIQYDKRSLRRYFHKQDPTATKKRFTYNRLDVKTFASTSKMQEAATAWNLLSAETKEDWAVAGLECGLTAYNLFQQDKIYRILNTIAGNATPNFYHQYKIGQIIIPVSGEHFLLRQTGNTIFTYPANFTICRNANLVTTNPGSEYIKVRVNHEVNNGGSIEMSSDEFELSLISGWAKEVMEMAEYGIQTGLWEIEIEGENVAGTLNFDNLYAETPEGILNRDYLCNKVESSYRGLVLPAGLTYGSVYPAD